MVWLGQIIWKSQCSYKEFAPTAPLMARRDILHQPQGVYLGFCKSYRWQASPCDFPLSLLKHRTERSFVFNISCQACLRTGAVSVSTPWGAGQCTVESCPKQHGAMAIAPRCLGHRSTERLGVPRCKSSGISHLAGQHALHQALGASRGVGERWLSVGLAKAVNRVPDRGFCRLTEAGKSRKSLLDSY